MKSCPQQEPHQPALRSFTLKSRTPSKFALAAGIAALLAAPQLIDAATYTWDSTAGGGAPVDGTGAWTTGTNWWNGTVDSAWTNLNTDTAVFGAGNGTAGAVTVGAVTVNGLTFNAASSGTYTLSSGTITLAGTTPTITSNVNAAIGSILAGTAGLTTTGTGTLTLTGTNTYSGGTTISAGKLQIGNGGIYGAIGSGNISIASGAILQFSRNTVAAPSWGSITGAGTLELTTSGSNQDWGTAGLASGFTGTLQIDSGRVSTNNASSLGNASTVIVGAGGQLGMWNGGTFPQNFIISGTGWGEAGFPAPLRLANAGGTTTLSGSVTLAASTGIVAGGTGILTNVISGPSTANLTFGGGVIVLQNASTYSGTTTVAYGTLQLGDGTAGHDATLATAGIVNSGAVRFNFFGNQTIAYPLSGGGSFLKVGPGTVILTGSDMSGSVGATSGTLQLGDGTTNNVTISSGTISAGATLRYNRLTPGGLAPYTVTGGGTLELSAGGTNQSWGGAWLPTGFTGTFQIDSGRVPPGGGTAMLGNASTVIVGAGGQLGLWSGGTFPQNFILSGTGYGEAGWETSLRLANSGQTTTLSGSVTLAATTAVGAGGIGIFSGVISGSNTANLIVGVGATTSGTIILQNANTFSGNTTVPDGMLILSNSAALQNSTLATAGIVFDPAVASHAFILGGLSGSGNLALTDTASNPVALSVGNNNSNTTYSGVLSGIGSLVKTGSGTLILAGTNTFTGNTLVSSGTLQLGNNLALQNSMFDPSGAGALAVSSSVTTPTLGGLTGSASLSMPSSVTALTLNVTSGTATYSGTIEGGTTMGLTKSGSGTLALIGASIYSGTTTVNAGILQLGDGTAGHDATLATAGIVNNNLQVHFNLYGNQTIAYPLSGNGTWWKQGTNTLTLTGSSSMAGLFSVQAGVLQVGSGGTTGVLNSAAFSVAGGATLQFNHATAVAPVWGNVTGAGTLELTTSGINQDWGSPALPTGFTGTLQIDAGRFATSGTSSVGNASTVIVGAGGQFAAWNGGTFPQNFVLSGTGWGEGGFPEPLRLGNVGSTATVTGSVTLATNTAIGASGTGILTGVISGSNVNLTIPSGVIVLQNASTYSGTTTVNGGAVLQLGDGTSGHDATLATAGIVNSGQVTYNLFGNQTIAYPLSGGGSWWKQGAGTLLLTGSNNMSGPVNVTSGTFQIGNGTTSNGNSSVIGSGSISTGATLWFNRLTASNSNLGFTGGGTLELTTGGVQQSWGNAAFSPSFTGTLQIDSGRVPPGGGTGILGNASTVIVGAGGQIGLWNGGTFPQNFILSGTGYGEAGLEGSLRLADTGTTTTLSGSVTLAASTTILVGGTGVVTGVISGSSTANLTFGTTGRNGLIVLQNACTYSGTTTVAYGTLQLGDGTSGHDGSLATAGLVNNAQVQYNLFGNQTVAYPLSGNGSWTKQGAGTLILTGPNTTTGAVSVTAGKLQIGNGVTNGALGSGNNSISAGATLQINRTTVAAPPWSKFTGAGTLELTTGGTGQDWGYAGLPSGFTGTLQIDSGRVSTYGAGSAGNASTVIVGSGGQFAAWYGGTFMQNFILSGTGWGEAGFPVSLRLGDVGYAATVSGSVTLAASTALMANGMGIISGVISGSSTANLNIGAPGTTGTIVLQNANTYSGTTTVNAGTLQLGDGTAGHDGSLATTGIVNSSQVRYNLYGNQSVAYALSGSGTWSKQGAGTLTLTGSNNTTGAVTVDSGVLQLGNGGTTGSLSPSGTIIANGTLVFNRSNTVTQGTDFASTISGSGSLVQAGSGQTVLSGSNSYSAGTTVSSGTLQIGNVNALGSGGLTVNAGTLDLNGISVAVTAFGGAGGSVTNNSASGTSTLSATVSSGSSSYGGAIANGAGSVALTKSGTGALILSGSLQMAGLNANAGNVDLTQSGSIGTVNVASGATLSMAAHTGGNYNVLSVSSLTISGFTSALASANDAVAADAAYTPAGAVSQPNTGVLTNAGCALAQAAAASDIEPASPEAVPEPGALGLLLAGALGLFGLRRRGNNLG